MRVEDLKSKREAQSLQSQSMTSDSDPKEQYEIIEKIKKYDNGKKRNKK